MVMGSGYEMEEKVDPTAAAYTKSKVIITLFMTMMHIAQDTTLFAVKVFIIADICDQTLPDSQSTDLNSSHLTSHSLSLPHFPSRTQYPSNTAPPLSLPFNTTHSF